MGMTGYVYLAIAIVAEVIATVSLKLSDGFTRPLPAAVVVAGYGVAFYCLSITLRTVPMGVSYAIWSGVGIVLITAAGWIFLNQRLDLPALIGMAMIVAGVAVMRLFSATG